MPRALKQNPSGPGYVEIADIEQLNVGNILPLAGALTIRGSTVDPRLLLGYGSGTVYVGRPAWAGQQDNVYINTVGGSSGDFTLSTKQYNIDVDGNTVIGGNLVIRNHGVVTDALWLDGLDIGGPGGVGHADRIGTLWADSINVTTLDAKETNLHGTNYWAWWINENYDVRGENVGLGIFTRDGADNVRGWHLWYDVGVNDSLYLQHAVSPVNPMDFTDPAYLRSIRFKTNGNVEFYHEAGFDDAITIGNGTDVSQDVIRFNFAPDAPEISFSRNYLGTTNADGLVYYSTVAAQPTLFGVQAFNAPSSLLAVSSGATSYAQSASIELYSNQAPDGVKGWQIIKNPTNHDLIFYMNDQAHGSPVPALTLLYDETSFFPTLSLYQGAEVNAIWNEPEMVSNDAMALATQQSIKTYVDNRVAKSQNMDIDIGTEVVDSLPDTDGDACWWFYVVKNGVNLRAGTVMACWEEAANAVRFIENSTADIGDTSGLTLSVGINIGTDEVELRATAASNDWSVRVDRMKLYTVP